MEACLTLTAGELVSHYRDRTLSPREVAKVLVDHVDRHEPNIHALYAYDPDALIREAAASERHWMNAAPRGPLDGVPVTIKELVATRGTPVPKGTCVTPLVPAAEDAPPAARLRESGALIYAKTTCPDFGMLSSGLSTFHALSRNPWNLACNPGGSSAGAGAAAAAGFGPLHLGTDIGGSVRLPAAWCGVVGFKPTLGRIPIDPYYVGRCAGPMTRTVEDAALMMSVLAQDDRRDAMRLPPESIDWSDLDTSLRGLKVGVLADAGCGLPLDEEIRSALDATAAAMRDAGAECVALPAVMTREMLDGLDRFWRARQWAELETLSPADRQRVLPYIVEWARTATQLSGVDAVRGFEQTLKMRAATEAVFDRVDIVLSPTTPNVAFPAQAASPTDDPTRPFEHIAYTVPWNMGEQPAISLPAGFSRDGMPIGVQLIGPRFADRRVLAVARAVESILALPARFPQLTLEG